MKLNLQEKIQKSIEVKDTIEDKSFSLLRLFGYILLVFSLIDYIAILIPLHLTDPTWELQTIGQLVDHVWAPLLGLILVFFYTKKRWVSPREIRILQCLSWFSLFLGLVYILMLPLGINNSLTIYLSNNNQITNQAAQQTHLLQKLNQQLNAANTPNQLKTIAKIINPQSDTQLKVPPQELKNQLSQRIQTAEKNVSNTANTIKQQQSIKLMKDAVRINLETLLSGVCLIIVWNLTCWVRVINKYLN